MTQFLDKICYRRYNARKRYGDFNMKIFSGNDPRDFGPWVGEKIEKALSCHIMLGERNPDVKKDSDYILTQDYLFMLYAYSHGDLNSIRCALTENFVKDYGWKGFKFIDDLLEGKITKGWISEIEEENHNVLMAEELLRLIRLNNKRMRTKINEYIDYSDIANSFFKQLSDDIDKVNLGYEKWDWFYDRHKSDEYYTDKKIDPRIIEMYEYIKSLKLDALNE